MSLFRLLHLVFDSRFGDGFGVFVVVVLEWVFCCLFGLGFFFVVVVRFWFCLCFSYLAFLVFKCSFCSPLEM